MRRLESGVAIVQEEAWHRLPRGKADYRRATRRRREQVDDNASFVDDLGADSLDIVELVMAFEEAFELEIPTRTPKRSAPSKTRQLHRKQIGQEVTAPRFPGVFACHAESS